MSRPKKDIQLKREMCQRLQVLIKEYAACSLSECSSQLGYANSTVLRKALAGEVFLDTERLYKLANLKTKDGLSPNLHWLITGEGSPTLPRESTSIHMHATSLLRAMPTNKLKSLVDFLET